MELKRQNHEFPPVYDENTDPGKFPVREVQRNAVFLRTSPESFLESDGAGFT